MSAAQARDRLYGFDAVRGLAAVAVVALHAAYPYALAPLPGLVWPLPLDEPSPFVDACFWCAEGFVMPLFFTISGFFLAKSLARQRPGAVAAGRARRLLVSFWSVGIVILGIDLLVWTAGFAATGQATWRDFRRMKFGPAIDDHLWGPAHLWYLEYLWVLCTAACVAAWAWRGTIRQFGPLILFSPRGTRLYEAIERTPFLVGLAALAVGLFAVLGLHPEVVLGFQHRFLIPAGPKLLHGGLFLIAGVLLFRSPGAVEKVRRAGPFLLAASAVLFAMLWPRIAGLRGAPPVGFDVTLAALLSGYAAAAVFGCLGSSLRWLDRPIPVLQRLAAASFWVYMAHHPICGLLQLAVRPAPWPPAVKFLVVTAVTLGVCLATYSRFVESGAIGRMLDGEWPWRALRPVEKPQPGRSESPPVRKAA